MIEFNVRRKERKLVLFSPIIISNRIEPPKLLIIIKTLVINAPTDPKASFITLAYVGFIPASVKRMRKSTETSASTATIRITTREGNTPRTLRIAGIDMIPDPITELMTLNTAPGTVPCSTADFGPVRRGIWTPANCDIPAVELLSW